MAEAGRRGRGISEPRTIDFSNLQREKNIFSNSVAQYIPILIELSELPLTNDLHNNFALNTHLYQIFWFLNNSQFQDSYNFPQYQIDVNVAKIKQAGLMVTDVLSVLQGYFGGVYASNFNKFGKQFRVMYQADAQYRANQQSLNSIFTGQETFPNFIARKNFFSTT